MAARGSGEILLSYARTAGTADQQIPGTVTSRRDRDQYKKQKLLKEKQEEERRVLAKQQETAARFLKRKWKEEDREERRRRRHAEEDGEAGEEDGRARARRRSRERSRSRSRGRNADASPPQTTAAHVAESLQPTATPAEPERRRFRETEDVRRGGWERVDMDPARPPSVEIPEPLPHRAPVAPVARRQQTAPSASASALGFGLDDDDDLAQRERAQAEMSNQKRALRRSSAAVALANEHQASGGSHSAARAPEQDAFENFRRLSEWKRSCQGARRAMPKDMESMVGHFAERQGGHVYDGR